MAAYWTCNAHQWLTAIMVAISVGLVNLLWVYFKTKMNEDRKLDKEHSNYIMLLVIKIEIILRILLYYLDKDLRRLRKWKKKFNQLRKQSSKTNQRSQKNGDPSLKQKDSVSSINSQKYEQQRDNP
jgi:hypothetical protein